jgi:superfamily II DNA or RNA helicase
MSLDGLPVRILQNKGGEHLEFARHLLGQCEDVRIISGYIRESGLNALGPVFEQLVMEGRVLLLSGDAHTQISRQAIQWFEARRRGEYIRTVPGNRGLGFVHAKAWLLRSPGAGFLWSLVGSANLTGRGLTTSVELGVWFSSPRDSTTAHTLENVWRELYECSEPASWYLERYCDEGVAGYDDTTLPAAYLPPAPSPPAFQGGLPTSDPQPTPWPGMAPRSTSGERPRIADTGTGQASPPPEPGQGISPPARSPWVYQGGAVATPEPPLPTPASPPALLPLQDFQEEAVQAIRDEYKAAARQNHPFAGVLSLPTGGGKTKVAVWWLLKDFVARGKTVLWIAHRSELLDQAQDTFLEHRALLTESGSDLSIARLDGQSKDLPEHANVILASTQTLVNAPALVKWRGAGLKVDCICYDEAHHALAEETKRMLEKLRRWSGDEIPILGLTATPFRTNMGKTTFLEELFDAQLVYQKTFGDLVHRGFLAEPVWRRLERDEYSRRVRLSAEDIASIQRQHEFTPDVLDRVAHDDEWNRAIIRRWSSERAAFGRSLLFACNIEHCDRLANVARRAGIDARVLTHLLSKDERREIVFDFKAGKYDLLLNVAILTEGTDLPDVETIVMARPTLSPVLHRQMLGRGARRGQNRTKARFYVLDCVQNCLFHDVGDLQMPGEGDWRN